MNPFEAIAKPETLTQFALEVASNGALASAIESYGREPVFLAWALGYHHGVVQGLKMAEAIRAAVVTTRPQALGGKEN